MTKEERTNAKVQALLALYDKRERLRETYFEALEKAQQDFEEVTAEIDRSLE